MGGFPHERLDAWAAGLRLVERARALASQLPEDQGWIREELLRQASAVPVEVAAGASEWRPGEARRRFRQARAAAARCGAAAEVAQALGARGPEVAEVRTAAEGASEACRRLVAG